MLLLKKCKMFWLYRNLTFAQSDCTAFIIFCTSISFPARKIDISYDFQNNTWCQDGVLCEHFVTLIRMANTHLRSSDTQSQQQLQETLNCTCIDSLKHSLNGDYSMSPHGWFVRWMVCIRKFLEQTTNSKLHPDFDV